MRLQAESRDRRAWRVLQSAAVVLATWVLLAFVLAQALVARQVTAHADALVVLSGAATYVERTRWAAQLYR